MSPFTFRRLTGCALALLTSGPTLAQARPPSKIAFDASQGSLIARVDSKQVRLSPGPGNWDWQPVLSPKGSYIAFLRQSQRTRKGVSLCLLRLADGRIMTLRNGHLGVPAQPLKSLSLRWKDSNTLALFQGRRKSLFDLRGRRLDTVSAPAHNLRTAQSVNFAMLAKRVLAQQSATPSVRRTLRRVTRNPQTTHRSS